MTAEAGGGVTLSDDERDSLADPLSEVLASFTVREDPDASLGLLYAAVERILAARLAQAGKDRAAVPPESATKWAEEHYIAYVPEDGGFATREATWRDAPTSWGEAADYFAALGDAAEGAT